MVAVGLAVCSGAPLRADSAVEVGVGVGSAQLDGRPERDEPPSSPLIAARVLL